MTAERQMEPVLGPLLEELAAPRVPDYFDAMMVQIVRAPQRRGWWWPGITPERTERSRGSLGPARLVPALVLAGLLLALLWAAAIGSRFVSRPPTLEQLMSRPWQDTPITPSAEVISAMDDYCLARLETIPGSKTRVLLDIRGGQQAHAIYAHDLGYSTCDLLLRQDGTLHGSYTLPAEGEPVASRNPMMGVEGPPRYGLQGGTGDDRVYGESVGGRIAPTVAAVDIVLVDGRRIHASVGGGFYFGWWVEEPLGGEMSRPLVVDRVEGLDPAGRVLTGVNGWFLPEFQDPP